LEILSGVEGRFRAVGEKCAKRLDKLADGISLIVALGPLNPRTADKGMGSE
jgi:hypothetical protein